MRVFMRLHFHPRMRAACTVQLQAASATLYYSVVIVLHRSKQAVRPQQNLALNLELRIYKSLGYFAEPDSDWS